MSISANYNYLLHLEITSDILQTIPDKDLPFLRDVFRSRWPYAAQAWHFINQLIDWKTLNPQLGVRFTAPEGRWQDGTFVAIVTEFNYQIYSFTLERSCERLCRALEQTTLIEWKKGPYICAIHEDHDEKIMDTLTKVDGEIDFDIESTCWWLSKKTAKTFEIKCPQNVTIRPLKPEHSNSINSVWPHKFPSSHLYLANMIAKNGGYGIFTNTSQPLLCSWVTTNDHGAVSILQTLPEYKRKGYAALLVKILAKKAAQNNLDSITYIVRKNMISQGLFKSLGFIKINNVRWVQFKQIENRVLKAKL